VLLTALGGCNRCNKKVEEEPHPDLTGTKISIRTRLSKDSIVGIQPGIGYPLLKEFDVYDTSHVLLTSLPVSFSVDLGPFSKKFWNIGKGWVETDILHYSIYTQEDSLQSRVYFKGVTSWGDTIYKQRDFVLYNLDYFNSHFAPRKFYGIFSNGVKDTLIFKNFDWYFFELDGMLQAFCNKTPKNQKIIFQIDSYGRSCFMGTQPFITGFQGEVNFCDSTLYAGTGVMGEYWQKGDSLFTYFQYARTEHIPMGFWKFSFRGKIL
jgi:hypothetical protein